MMQGGPGLMYVPEVLHVLDQLAPKDASTADKSVAAAAGNSNGGH